MSQPIRVFLLDDESFTLKVLHEVWSELGFEVETAASSREARGKLRGHEKDFDVLVLDMFLKGETTTGADVGIEVREQAGAEGPEFLILSAYDFQDYYQKALLLGASAYLRKAEYTDPVKVASHVRALALRRALRASSESVMERIRSLAMSAVSQENLVERYCRDVLVPELGRVLSSDFFLILSVGRSRPQILLADGASLTAESGVREIEALLVGNLGSEGRFVVGSAMTDLAAGCSYALPLRRLLLSPGSALCQLVRIGDLWLTLGMRQSESLEPGLPNESVAELAMAIGRYVHPGIMDPLIQLLHEFGAAAAEARAAKSAAEAREARKNSAQFCLAMSGELRLLAQSLERASPDPASAVRPVHAKLARLVDELRRTGEELDELEGPAVPSAVSNEGSWDLHELVGELARELVEQGLVPSDWQLEIGGKATTTADRNRIRRALQRLLRWFSGRGSDTNPEGRPEFQVMLSEDDRYARIELRDRSSRIPADLRPNLFKPLVTLEYGETREGYMGLYLAREIARAEGGSLLDLSDDQGADELGHRFELSLPK